MLISLIVGKLIGPLIFVVTSSLLFFKFNDAVLLEFFDKFLLFGIIHHFEAIVECISIVAD